MRRKTDLTSGQIARICKVSMRTVAMWIDKGHLKGYRIPGSRQRRVHPKELSKFMVANGMPTFEFDRQYYHKVLVIGGERTLREEMRKYLPEAEDYRHESAHGVFDAGLMAESFRPDTIVIDLDLGRTEVIQIIANLRNSETHREIYIVALTTEDDPQPQNLIEAGASDVIKKPFDLASLAALIREAKK